MNYEIRQGDVLDRLREMPDESVNCCVTSPPYYGLRDYGVDGQIGLEETPDLFISRLTEVFREVRRVLRSDGTCWINIGDSYAGSWGAQSKREGEGIQAINLDRFGSGKSATRNPRAMGCKPKDLIGVPWMLAFALRGDGWYLRSEIIWHKPNPMPESIKDRPTKAHEQVFLFSRSQRYNYDHTAIFEPLMTNASDNYPVRARITGRGKQEASADRGNDRDKSGGFPPSYNGSSFNKGKSKDAREGVQSKVGDGPRVEAAGRNKRSVWTMATQPTPDAHFATFPLELPETCILAGCPVDGLVLDPFAGAGTTGLAALKNGRRFLGIELNPEYINIAHRRLDRHCPLLAGIA